MGELLTPSHLLIVAVVALVLFGGKKLPELGKGIGQGFRELKAGLTNLNEEIVDDQGPERKTAEEKESA